MLIRRLSAGVASAALVCATLSFAPAAQAREEGMWTFDNFPLARVNRELGTNLTQGWLDHIRMSAVRLTTGCSASVVSPEGLVLTNHHCVLECVQNLSSPENDYVQNGWLTATRDEERQCPGMAAEILTEITDVTDQITAAGEGLEGDAYVQARTAAATRIEREACGDDDTRRCQVISFYRGGEYKLYEYDSYSDVRLVFAPEMQAGFFGGDPDNFNFPRYALDAGFLRLYRDGQPVRSNHFLTWNPNTPAEGDATFVAGNPGSTARLLTVSQMEAQRDFDLPIGQLQRSELRGRLIAFSEQSDENARIALDPLFGVENSFKAIYGRDLALNDRAFMQRIRDSEADLRARVAADPALAERIGDPWSEIDAVQDDYADLFLPYRQLVSSAGGGSTLYGMARAIVRATVGATPGASTAALERALSTDAPIEPELEEMYLSFWLSKTREYLTVDHPAVRQLLGSESPEALADRLVSGTTLMDREARLALLRGGAEAVQASTDPLIQFVLANDATSRQTAAEWNNRITAPTNRAAERIAAARFAVYGNEAYPDATFSLRLSYGRVAGWTYRGQEIEPFTYINGLYDRATGSSPFDLAPQWAAAQGRVNGDVVFDYTTTNDIIGGNSGSPVVNAAGEVVGAAFDGNIHSLGGNYGYDGALNRTVVVSSSAITEALRNVYGREALLHELGVH
ncbi:S46 family peptidase [Brevundimonas aveniformis]|uniref:S46 family peptidase n=1 Tax=Brevundimonas aveniformis TaxID=370977 RepID=UPI00248F589D|nr:S46 family peptidase [Brevundimonas aveniformis]